MSSFMLSQSNKEEDGAADQLVEYDGIPFTRLATHQVDQYCTADLCAAQRHDLQRLTGDRVRAQAGCGHLKAVHTSATAWLLLIT